MSGGKKRRCVYHMRSGFRSLKWRRPRKAVLIRSIRFGVS